MGGWLGGGGVGVREEQAGDRLAESAPRALANLRFALLKKHKLNNKMQKQTGYFVFLWNCDIVPP